MLLGMFATNALRFLKNSRMGVPAALFAAFVFVFFVATAGFALATATDNMGVGVQVNDLLGVLTGPIAKAVAAGIIITCVVALMRGHDLGDFVPKVLVAGIGVGLLIILSPTLLKIQASGTMIPAYTAHAVHFLR